MKTEEPRPVLLKDYAPAPYRIDEVALEVDLDPAATRVHSKMIVRPNGGQYGPGTPLTLDGQGLTLHEVRLNGETLSPNQYQVDAAHLILPDVPDEAFTLEMVTDCAPEKNTALSGLYLSGGIFCTQCEAEGFRRFTYYLDRPDMMAVFTTRIIGDRVREPILLSNGNLVRSGTLDNGRHFAEWHDPFPKPCYLFALVAGRLVSVEDKFITQSGRAVALKIFVEPGNEDRCSYAMDALKRAMRWDEEVFGREYDLDIFMIVAVSAFNMGAMENKGLNIFNDKYILARPDTATDADYAAIEAIVAHEYFHNWTGNRVTCRDWFQLCLKEGLTVFRDQEFTGDMRNRAVKRISDVRMLRSHQFPEDAGPLAHPVRPDSYIEINNFYTATVYEKGAELVRMLHTLLGPKGFRAGMDLYFDRHDGEAATVENFLDALADATGADLGQFRRWYAQAGTPEVLASGRWDSARKTYTLKLSQVCAPTPGQPHKEPFYIPIKVGLVARSGDDMPLCIEGQDEGRTEDETAAQNGIVHLTSREQTFRFTGLASKPIPSLLRGFTAPVKLTVNLSERELIFLMAHDKDLFNRWEAGQKYATSLLIGMVTALHQGGKVRQGAALAGAMGKLLADTSLEADFVAQMMVLPSEQALAQTLARDVDVDMIHEARQRLRRSLGQQLRAPLREAYERNKPDGPYRPDAHSAGRRALRNLCLGYLAVADEAAGAVLATHHFEQAGNMTDCIAALGVLADMDCPERTATFDVFYRRWKDDHLVIDKWFAIQAMSSQPNTLAHVKDLTAHPAFSLNNPNKVRALISSFAAANQVRFHGADGTGYSFVADKVLALDRINPQIAARLLGAFKTWRQFDRPRRELMVQQLNRIAGTEGLSRDVYEIATKTLA